MGLQQLVVACAAACTAVAAASAAAAWPVPAKVGSRWTSAGNHRFRIDVVAPAGSVVEAAVPWRRRDAFVTSSDTFIVAGAANATTPLVPRCYRNDSSLSSTVATFAFASDGSPSFYLYYLPFSTCEYAGGGCQYDADATYDARSHCSDAPWWPAGTPLLAPTAVAYESGTAFDAFTDMERPMSAAEFAAFLAASAPPPPLGALLIAERGNSSARLWGAGYGAAAAAAAPQAPFCVWGEAAGAWFLKTGGDPTKRDGWDHGDRDKCCSSDAADCEWFGRCGEGAAGPRPRWQRQLHPRTAPH